MIQDLYKLLIRLHKESDKPFSGLGLLICSDTTKIPIYPLYRSTVHLCGTDLFEQLSELSSLQNTHHDGFHVISQKLEITHIAQYFYPNPVLGMSIDANKHYGARYFVAKIGSTIPEVLYSAVVGTSYGVCIFKNGQELLDFKND